MLIHCPCYAQYNYYGAKGEALTIRVMTFNTSTLDSYTDQESIRLMQGLAPDIALLEEWSVANADYRSFVDNAFGAGFSYVRDPLGSSAQSLANGVISRWPFIAAGSWRDVEVSGRWFTYATIDIPGETNLQVVAAHLKAGNTADDVNRREIEANNLKFLVQGGFDNNQYILVGGDLNTGSLAEPCLSVFSTFLAYNNYVPADRNGNSNTNRSRTERYDWLMPNQALVQWHDTLSVGGEPYPSGIVFDSHVFTPLSAVPPIQYDDTHNANMDHDPVMKSFVVPIGPTPVPVPRLEGFLSTDTVRIGAPLTFEAAALPPPVKFDAYGGIISSNGEFLFSFYLPDPYYLQNGLQPVDTRVTLTAPVRKTLYIIPSVPPGYEGLYTFIVGFVPSGRKPAIANVLSDYLWEGPLEVID